MQTWSVKNLPYLLLHLDVSALYNCIGNVMQEYLRCLSRSLMNVSFLLEMVLKGYSYEVSEIYPVYSSS